MPELPEVETVKNGLLKHLIGKKFRKVILYRKNLRYEIPSDLENKLKGLEIIDIIRRGKYLLFKLKSGYLMIHLGMSGVLQVSNGSKELKKHDHVQWDFDDDLIMRYNDTRRFGLVLFSNTLEHKLLSSLGVEPLENKFTADFLYKITQNKSKRNIKSIIMDSHIVVGVGNIYACESLFASCINPTTLGGRISKKNIGFLVLMIKKILKDAIKQGGTTLKDFKNSAGNPGYFKQKLQVYSRENELCNICNEKIIKIKQNTRSTFYCKKCQII